MRCLVTVLAVALLLTAAPARAQEPGTAGFLFVYQPEAGQRALFEEGYRAHLEWHRERGDSLSWHGWTVAAGPGLGRFVDGVFGVDFAALDARVDPMGDARDAALHVTSHAEPVTRQAVRLRRELSTATPLETGSPTPLAQVVRYPVGPGATGLLEAAFQALRESASDRGLLPYTIYEVAAGGRAGFVMIVWRTRFGSFDAPDRDPARALSEHLAVVAGDGAPGVASDVTSQIWRYRPDLTYLAGETP